MLPDHARLWGDKYVCVLWVVSRKEGLSVEGVADIVCVCVCVCVCRCWLGGCRIRAPFPLGLTPHGEDRHSPTWMSGWVGVGVGWGGFCPHVSGLEGKLLWAEPGIEVGSKARNTQARALSWSFRRL